MKFLILALMTTGWITHATNLPDEKTYHDDTELMMNICGKFVEEPDAAKLHKAAVSTQYARVISCSDYNGECNLYGKCLSLVIAASAGGSVSSSDRIKLRGHMAELRRAVDLGRRKLQKAWEAQRRR